jgi:ATP-dependent Clp protease ATP-binding subunit ClpA
VIGAGATSGGAMDASNLLKPALASGTLRCIGSTTYKEYRQHFEKDRALVRRFQKIDVNEPSVEDAIEILKGLKPYFEDYHKLKYTAEAIEGRGGAVGALHQRPQAAGQGDRRDRRDRRGADAGAGEQAQEDHRLKEIEATIATMARIPPKTVSKDDAEVLKHLTTNLKRVVYGQDEGDRGADLIDQAGPCRPARPGKADRLLPVLGTDRRRQDRGRQAARGVARRRAAALRHVGVHGAPHGEPPDRRASRLCGLRPGRPAHRRVDQHPHCVLLLDEIEKAHPDLFNILLQVMDHGKLTDHNGKQVDFRNVILIMTTNAGRVRSGQGSLSASRSRSAPATTS